MPDRSLAACPPGRNCVSSQALERGHFVQPLAFPGDAAMAWRIALQAVTGLPGTRLVDSADGYLRAECVRGLLRSRDDLELVIDVRASLIHVRSSARRGFWDLGANRRRVERLRKSFDQQMARLGKPPGAL